jgi:PhzF family phenazine biosynthesis protein
MKPKLYQVDAFTKEPFKGNPAGVMILTEELLPGFMQNIAMEMNLSETAFVIPSGNDFSIRYFTPVREVPLCGHASLASAHIIYESGLKKPGDSFIFKAQGGDLLLSKEVDKIVMNFPAYPLRKISLQADYQKAIGFTPVEVYSSNYDWMILIAVSEDEILNATPDFDLLIKNGLGHLMITAQSTKPDVDFVLRCFAPLAGINEDPVTGSAHCALTPLWSGRLTKTYLNSLQLSKRTGKLTTRLVNDRVEIKGSAVTVFEAELKV